MIAPGTEVRRRGYVIVVHETRDGMVYFHRRAETDEGAPWPQPGEGWPLGRMTVEAFRAAIDAATDGEGG